VLPLHHVRVVNLVPSRGLVCSSVRAVGIEPTSSGLRIRCLSSRPDALLITSIFNFQRRRDPSMPPQSWVARESNPASFEKRLIYSQARVHSGIATHIASGRRESNPPFRHGKPACHRQHFDRKTHESHRAPVGSPIPMWRFTRALDSLVWRLSYEGVSSRPPTDRTPLLGFGDQAGPRPWPRRSCSCVRRACPASSLLARVCAPYSVPETPKGREPFSVRRPLGRSWFSWIY